MLVALLVIKKNIYNKYSKIMISRNVIIQNQERHQQLNNRYTSRQMPDNTLQSSFSIRATPTRYVTMPIVDIRAQSTVPLQKTKTHNVETNFNPGTRVAPWAGYANNVDTETVLRGTIFPLQAADQAKYVPSTVSDLYNNPTITTSQPVQQTNEGLFEQQTFDNHNPNRYEEDVGFKLFDNHTRQQTRNISIKTKRINSD